MISVLATAAYLLLLLIKAASAWTHLRRYPAPGPTARAVEVTVLQPILSGDPGLAHALEDNLRELPEAAFLWLVDEGDGLAQAVAHGLAGRYASQAVRVLTLPAAPEGVNPKLFKLEASWRLAATPVCVILDDDTRLPRRSLDALVEALDDTEVSTGLPYYRDADDFPSRLLAQFVNDNAALTYLPLLAIKPPVTLNGTCYAIRRATLDGIGGFEPVLRHLTDDLAVARHVRRSGGRLRQTPYPQEVETHLRNTAHYKQQMHRWFLFATLLARSEPPGTALLIGLLQGIHPILLWIVLLGALLSPSPAAAASLGALLLLRASVIIALQRRLTGRARLHFLLSLLSELLQPLHLLHAVCVRSIRWRSRTYRVYANDRFESR